MTKAEILVTPLGEMSDMFALYAIEHGTAKEKKKLSFDEVMELT
jgi:hypothetical protein